MKKQGRTKESNCLLKFICIYLSYNEKSNAHKYFLFVRTMIFILNSNHFCLELLVVVGVLFPTFSRGGGAFPRVGSFNMV